MKENQLTSLPIGKFFVETKYFLFQHSFLTKFLCCSLKFLVHKEGKIAQKVRENVAVGKKKYFFR